MPTRTKLFSKGRRRESNHVEQDLPTTQMLSHAQEEMAFVLDAAREGRLLRITNERHPITDVEGVGIDPSWKPGPVVVVSFMVKVK